MSLPELKQPGRSPLLSESIPPPRRVENRPSGVIRIAIALVCLVALALFLEMVPAQAKVEPDAGVCPTLLMDFECARYHRQLEEASSREERLRVQRAYRKLIDERRKLCRYGEPHELRETLSQAGLLPR